MKPINECIIISNPMFAGLFSGSDVWMIPYDIRTCKLDYDRAYVWDDWTIYNHKIFGMDSELCVIAVEPDALIWRMCDETFIFRNELADGWEFIAYEDLDCEVDQEKVKKANEMIEGV